MNALFVYAATKYQLGAQIEWFTKQGKIQPIAAGEQLLDPGVYRFADKVKVTALGTPGDSEVVALPEVKNPYPDPPMEQRIARVTAASGVTRKQVVIFLGGAGDEIEVGGGVEAGAAQAR